MSEHRDRFSSSTFVQQHLHVTQSILSWQNINIAATEQSLTLVAWMFIIPYESSSGLEINASLRFKSHNFSCWRVQFGSWQEKRRPEKKWFRQIINKATHSSSSSVAKRLTRKPLSAFPDFWNSNPPISLASRFSSSLASGLGAVLTCKQQNVTHASA